jgi:ATPase subunit of ABC transporter with duplicated ATPase domains
MHVFLTIDEKKLPKNSPWIKNTNTFAYKKDTVADRPYAKPIEDGRVKYNIDDLQHMTLHTLVEFMDMYVAHTEQPMQLAERIIRPLLDRARIIDELGLDYITLHRQIGTLSGGEIQRLRLAKQLGNKLTGIIYVLDEPTIGLSDREIQKTIHAIKKTTDDGKYYRRSRTSRRLYQSIRLGSRNRPRRR